MKRVDGCGARCGKTDMEAGLFVRRNRMLGEQHPECDGFGDAIIGEIDIPGIMNGFEFAQWARSVRPEGCSATDMKISASGSRTRLHAFTQRSFQGHECHRASPNSTRTAATAAQTNKFRCGGGGGVGVSVTRCPSEIAVQGITPVAARPHQSPRAAVVGREGSALTFLPDRE